MPPLSHVITFYTSVATVFVAEEPSPDLEVSILNFHPSSEEARKNLYLVSHPNSQERIGVVELDPSWQNKGQLHTIVYISRWCPEFKTYRAEESLDYDSSPEKLNVLLVENVEGWGEVKRRVQMLEVVELPNWRKAEPRWEVVSLA
jgi:hypothetical protein